MKHTVKLGKIGEHLLMAELLKYGINAEIIGRAGIKSCPDILLEGMKTVEVKTSVFNHRLEKVRNFKTTNRTVGLYTSGWGFGFVNRSRADFLVLVLLNEDLSIYKFITFPKGHIKSSIYHYRKPIGLVQFPKGRLRTETVIEKRCEYINLIVKQCATSLVYNDDYTQQLL